MLGSLDENTGGESSVSAYKGCRKGRWGVSPASLVLRSKELGVISDVSARRAYQRLQQLKTTGLLRPEPIATYPGETPTLLLRAFELAERHGLTLKELAAELAWSVGRVRQLLGQTENRPSLRLVE